MKALFHFKALDAPEMRLFWFVLCVPVISLAPSSLAYDSGQENIIELSPYEVTTEDVVRYRALQSNSATRIALDLNVIPFNISVLNRDYLDDISARDSNEVFASESSTHNSTPFIQVQSTRPYIRGTSSSRFYVDGLFYNSLISPDGATERVEILKGPSGMLFGQAEPGGTINYVLKQPRAKHVTKVEAMIGSFDQKAIGYDWGGPVGNSKRLTGRFTAQYEEKLSDWIDYFENRKLDLYGRLRYEYAKGSFVQLTLFGNRQDINGIPRPLGHNPEYKAYNGVLALQIIRDRYVNRGLPNVLENGLIDNQSFNEHNPDSFADILTTSVIAEITHRFERAGTLRIVGTLNHMDRDGWRPSTGLGKVVYGNVDSNQAVYDRFNDGKPIIERNGDILSINSGDLRLSDTYAKSVVANWLHEFNTDWISYKLVLGYDWTFERFTDKRWRSDWHYTVNPATGLSVIKREVDRYQPVVGNAFRPEEGLLRISPPFETYIVPDGEFDNTVEGPGYYAFNFFDFFRGRWIVTASLRYDRYKAINQTTRQDLPHDHPSWKSVVEARGSYTTWSVGSIYNITSWMGMFGSWSTSFRPILSVLTNRDGEMFQAKPTTGNGGDAGLRFSLLDDRLSIMASGFLVQREHLNQRVSELGPDGFFISYDVQMGEEQSYGVEFEAIGELTQNFQLRFGWTHFMGSELKTNPENPALEGQPLRYTPKHKLVVTPRYEFNAGRLAGLVVGCQWISVIDDHVYPSGPRDPIELRPYYSGFNVVNFFASKTFRNFSDKYRLKVQLNVANVLNEKYTVSRQMGPTRWRLTTTLFW